MGKIITTSVDEQAEALFRKKAYVKFGRRKGALGKALSEAMVQWARSEEDGKDVVTEALELLRTGTKMKKWQLDRDQLHER